MKPHIHLEKDDRYARTLVCGAPERAEKIAAKLENAKCLAKNREYHSYLGRYRGKELLVVSHGVGASGATICFQELMDVGAKTIVRLGTAGGLCDDSEIGEIIVPTGAIRKDGVSALMVPACYPAVPDSVISTRLLEGFKAKGIQPRSGIILTSDLFYPGLLDPELEFYRKANAVGVEMECSALFISGALRNVKTAAVLVSDGNPLRWKEGHYDPRSDRLKESVEKCIEVCLETLASDAV